MIKVQNPCRLSRAARVKQAPEPASTIPPPDHVWSALEALAQRCEPQQRREGRASSQDSHPPTLRQPRDALPWPRAMLARLGQHTPISSRAGGACLWAHQPQAATAPSRHRPLGLRPGREVGLEGLHGPLPSGLYPTPRLSGADSPSTGLTRHPRGPPAAWDNSGDSGRPGGATGPAHTGPASGAGQSPYCIRTQHTRGRKARGRSAGPLGAHGFAEGDCEDTSNLLRRQDQGGE